MNVIAGLRRYAEVNGDIKTKLLSQNKVTVEDVNGQRYLGCALDCGKTIEIHGTAGNDLACYLNGGRIIVHGNASAIQGAVGRLSFTVIRVTHSVTVCVTERFIYVTMYAAEAVSI